jgi:hypothetical protein
MEDRSWMYDGVGGDPILYFIHVTQFAEAANTHTLCKNKKEIWCACKNCENNVLRSLANVMHGSTHKAFANGLSHLSMGTSDSSKYFVNLLKKQLIDAS